MIKENRVAVLKKDVFTYSRPPYDPPEIYPELKGLPYEVKTDPSNKIYGMVREALSMYGMDTTNYGTKSWNPLSEIIEAGDTVVIKPNLVMHKHPLGEEALLSSITHASILRPIIDYTILALECKGEIIICDGPLEPADFEKIAEIAGLKELMIFYGSRLKNLKVSLLDLRETMIHPRRGVIQLKGDPLGYSLIDLGKKSLHSEIDVYWRRYRENLRKYHTDNRHLYLISNTVLNSDVIISVPKLKTHKKAGITAALKNFFGITSARDSLPHCRRGIPAQGGDEWPYPFKHDMLTITEDLLANLIAIIPSNKCLILLNQIRKSFMQLLHNITNGYLAVNDYAAGCGAWYGNDTLWRSILDINMIVRYANKKGELCDRPQRKIFSIIDGIICQEGLGPMHGTPKKCGTVIVGMNPCAIDYVASKIMGFNPYYLKQVVEPFKRRKQMSHPLVDFSTDELEVISNVEEYININKLPRSKSLRFKTPNTWKILEKTDFI